MSWGKRSSGRMELRGVKPKRGVIGWPKPKKSSKLEDWTLGGAGIPCSAGGVCSMKLRPGRPKYAAMGNTAFYTNPLPPPTRHSAFQDEPPPAKVEPRPPSPVSPQPAEESVVEAASALVTERPQTPELELLLGGAETESDSEVGQVDYGQVEEEDDGEIPSPPASPERVSEEPAAPASEAELRASTVYLKQSIEELRRLCNQQRNRLDGMKTAADMSGGPAATQQSSQRPQRPQAWSESPQQPRAPVYNPFPNHGSGPMAAIQMQRQALKQRAELLKGQMSMQQAPSAPQGPPAFLQRPRYTSSSDESSEGEGDRDGDGSVDGESHQEEEEAYEEAPVAARRAPVLARTQSLREQVDRFLTPRDDLEKSRARAQRRLTREAAASRRPVGMHGTSDDPWYDRRAKDEHLAWYEKKTSRSSLADGLRAQRLQANKL